MHSWTWRAIIFGAVATVLVYTVTRPDPELSSLSSASPSLLIELLGSSRDVVRRAAATQLLAHGEDAVPILRDAAFTADEYGLEQIILVLEDLYVSVDERIADAAEDALETLATCDVREVRHAADQVFQANSSRRYLRACAKIEAFGGKFVSSAAVPRRGDSQLPFDIVLLQSDWTGGDEGLKYLRRIRNAISVHVEDAAPVSEDGLELLESWGYNIRREHEACLGVELQERWDRALAIRRLVAGSPADQADLHRLDELVELDGKPVGRYADFIRVIRQLHKGDRVRLVVRREGVLVPVELTLGSDFGTGRCRCGGDDEPLSAADQDQETVTGGGRRGRFRQLPATTDRISPFVQEPFQPSERSVELVPVPEAASPAP